MRQPVSYHNDSKHDPTGFKARARAHQSKFREEQMKVDFVDLYGTKISIDDGHSGLHNFHPLAHYAVKARYPNQRQTLYCDILRSEHIPFNLFAPLNEYRELLVSVLNNYMQGTVKSVEKITVEYAPQPKVNYLNDATSFDTCIEYTHMDGSKGLVGIEVKYTEGDYTIGTKESIAANDPDSLYWKVTAQSSLYRNDSFPLLIEDRYRQVWRNHILGESIKQRHPDTWKHFTLVMLYPEGNTHIGDVAQEYAGMLQDNRLNFIPITYQGYLQACQANATDYKIVNWLHWCIQRYLHE
jgi:hypothetical protein